MKKIILSLIALSIVLGCSVSKKEHLESPIVQEEQIKQEENKEDFKQIILKLHNEVRKNKNLKELKMDEKLCDYAQKHAEYMNNKNRLVHSNMKNLMNVDSESKIVAENIAWNQSTEKDVFSDWMNSFGHRSNILGKNYSKIGIGMSNENGKIYWCVVFSN